MKSMNKDCVTNLQFFTKNNSSNKFKSYQFLKTALLISALGCFVNNSAMAELASVPTLDNLHNEGAVIPGVKPAEVYPQSAYKLTKVDTKDENTITKFEYDKTTGKMIPVYYRVDLRQNDYGQGDAVKYFEWLKNGSEHYELKEVPAPTPDKSTITLNYDSLNPPTKIFNEKTDKIGDIDVNFIGNNSSPGGAIYNAGEIGDIKGIFIGNSASSPGGAIYNDAGNIGNITAHFIGNHSSAIGGAIYNQDGKIGNITGDFIGNYSTSPGGAIYNDGSIGNITGDFIGNYANYSGGVIYNTGVIGNINGNFTDNRVNNGPGGVIYNGGTIADITGNFSSNHSSSPGGAIYNDGTIADITGNFIENYTSSSPGGAIYNDGTIKNITGNFVNNRSSRSGMGGAIYNSNRSSEIGDITSDFIGNSAAGSTSQGGAIYNYGKIGNIKGNFVENYVSSGDSSSSNFGGAIYNSGEMGNITGNFINNYTNSASAYTYGGAIFNSGGKIGNITGDFIGTFSTSIGQGLFGLVIDNSHSSEIGNITGNFLHNYAKDASFAQGIVISNNGIIGDIKGNFIDNHVSNISGEGSSYGGAIYNTGTIGNITGDFINNYIPGVVYTSGGAISNGGTIGNIKGNFISNHVSSLNYMAIGGAIENGSSSIGNITGNFKSNYAFSKSGNAFGGAIYKGENASFGLKDSDGKITGGIINSSFYDNYAKTDSGTAKGGAIYTYGDLNIIADNHKSVFSGNYTQSNGVKDNNAIYLAISSDSEYDSSLGGHVSTYTPAKLTLEAKSNGVILFNDKIDGEISEGKSYLSKYNSETGQYDKTWLDYEKQSYSLTLKGDKTGTIILNNNISGNANIDLYKVTLNLSNRDNVLNGNNLNMHSGVFSMINNQAGISALNTFTLSGDTKMLVDVDLKNMQMDRITADSYGDISGKLHVTGMNLLSDAKNDKTAVYFAQSSLKNNVINELGTADYQATVMTPIFKYNVTYDNKNQYNGQGDGGYFLFTRGGGSSNSSDSFNPSVLAPSVAGQAGAFSTQSQTFNYVFQSADTYMNIPYLERISLKYRNRYAMSPTGDATDVGTFSPLFTRQESGSVWVKPYSSFENIPLKNGPKVSNITYGSLIGFDSDMKSIRNGFDRVITGYIGYNGSSQRYSGVDSTQNGGLIGATATFYKGNFFNATTLSVGASAGNNKTMYGSEDFALLLAGIGNKTGYNFEFKEGRIIIQPSMLISYTFVNTFDYTNAAGVRIKNDPLNAIQLAPGVKIIGNTENGWQPYIGINMVWNLLDKSKVTADDVRLPEMSIKPYVQYGVGVQKRVKDNFTAFGQAMIQNGGRNGISLTAGCRIMLDNDSLKEKVQNVKNVISNNRSLNDNKLSVNVGIESAQISQIKTPSRKIIKQMSDTQRSALDVKPQNTTRTTSLGVLKQL